MFNRPVPGLGGRLRRRHRAPVTAAFVVDLAPHRDAGGLRGHEGAAKIHRRAQEVVGPQQPIPLEVVHLGRDGAAERALVGIEIAVAEEQDVGCRVLAAWFLASRRRRRSRPAARPGRRARAGLICTVAVRDPPPKAAGSVAVTVMVVPSVSPTAMRILPVVGLTRSGGSLLQATPWCTVRSPIVRSSNNARRVKR